jgi:GNAT superfamily N-acetyltransferase
VPENIEIEGYGPGALGVMVTMQAAYYACEWGFGLAFETKIASEMAEFLNRIDETTDMFALGRDPSGSILGGITIDGGEGGELAHLRWFMVSDAARGRGLGRRLIAHAVDFTREAGHAGLYLWTFKGLDPARRLYDDFGFSLVEEVSGETWGREVVEQRFELRF